MMDGKHILVVEDDPDVCALISEYLSDQGFLVSTAGDGNEMRRVIEQRPVNLILLDVMLPGEDGLSIARSLRAANHAVPIIMLTGRGETIDRIVGLEIGADDYLAKPFHMRELLARVRSVLRRTTTTATERSPPKSAQTAFAGWRLDHSRRELYSPSGDAVRLTSGEFDLLVAFVANANRVLSRDRLLDLARDRKAGPFDRTIDVQVGRLRRKLEQDPQRPQLIKTVRGGGYMFTAPAEHAP